MYSKRLIKGKDLSIVRKRDNFYNNLHELVQSTHVLMLCDIKHQTIHFLTRYVKTVCVLQMETQCRHGKTVNILQKWQSKIYGLWVGGGDKVPKARLCLKLLCCPP